METEGKRAGLCLQAVSKPPGQCCPGLQAQNHTELDAASGASSAGRSPVSLGLQVVTPALPVRSCPSPVTGLSLQDSSGSVSDSAALVYSSACFFSLFPCKSAEHWFSWVAILTCAFVN
jgi:hypothetical protein